MTTRGKKKSVPGRFVTPGPLPTPFEREVLTVLIEECAEVVQRATKALRFGIEESQPGQQEKNWQRLGYEIGDLQATIGVACHHNIISMDSIMVGIMRKRSRLAKYMQTNPPAGRSLLPPMAGDE